jgi:hypothetical protein
VKHLEKIGFLYLEKLLFVLEFGVELKAKANKIQVVWPM